MDNYIHKKSEIALRIGIKINNKKYYLSSHRFYSIEKIDASKTRIMFHCQLIEGQKWKFIPKYKGLYYISYDLRDYGMKDWNLHFDIESRNVYLSKNLKTLWKLEKIDRDNFYIKDALYGYYLNVSTNNERDYNSFYGTISSNDNENLKNEFFFVYN